MFKFAENQMLKSALCTQGAVHAIDEILEWVTDRRHKAEARVIKIPLDQMRAWSFEPGTGNLRHETGRFFTIEGIRVKTNWGFVPEWEQPIICQPEVGILGILCREFNGILHFLLQAKIEPGNIGFVQLAPTLQATKSNYTQVHKGAAPRFLEYFLSNAHSRLHLDVLQSEQGSKYLRKRNRNIIIEVTDELDTGHDFRWVTLGQIGQLLRHDNIVNMDTRTVISCISYGSYDRQAIDLLRTIISNHTDCGSRHRHLLLSVLDNENHLHTMPELISWLTRLKTKYELSVDRIPLNTVREWHHDDREIRHQNGKYFSVMAVETVIGNREVASWCQPLIRSAQVGIVAFLIKKIHGIYHFLVQAKLEAGNMDILELAPTVQCVNDNYRESIPEQKPAFLDYVLTIQTDRIWYDTHQSEEGGRFFHEQHRSMIIEADEDFPIAIPETYCWMTLNQIKVFIHFNNYFNMEARSLISAVGLW